MTYQLKLPVPPNIANKSRGWHRFSGFYKQTYYKECAPYVKEAVYVGSLKGNSRKWTTIGWRAHVEVHKKMDFDNLVARLKWAIDALKYFGLLEDDDPDHCWPLGFPTQEASGKRGKSKKFVTLTIEVFS